jgi:amino acid adenylation domain-containing protein
MDRADPSLPLAFSYTETVLDLFSNRVRLAPSSVALRDDLGVWTYQEVADLSDSIGQRLAETGIDKNSIVAIYASRSSSLVPALLGVWKAGAAFVILDSSYPAARTLDYATSVGVDALIVLEAAGELPAEFELLLNNKGFKLRADLPVSYEDAAAKFPPGQRNQDRQVLDADDTAYVLFTSGTTAKPKAIATPHSALPHFLRWYAKTFNPGPEDRFSMLSGLSHDPLMRDIFVPLSVGATLCIPNPDLLKLPRRLLQWMGSTQITLTHLTPSLARLLIRLAQAGVQPLPSLRYALTGGEPLRFPDVLGFRKVAPGASLVNCYGASETPQIMAYTINAPSSEIGERGIVPFDSVVDDVQMLILREDRTLAGFNETGEICVRTKYLSKGYLNSPNLTAERFIANPFASSGDSLDRIYRTGDLGKLVPDVGIEYVGRADNQVKIRGFRVELEEIETVLRSSPLVSDAAVLCDANPDDPLLYAFVQVSLGFDLDECKRLLASSLPNYMIPRDIFEVSALPHNPNGKVDRQQLLSLIERLVMRPTSNAKPPAR